MSEPEILTPEQQLCSAHETIVTLTAANAELTKQLADAEARYKKLKRNTRNDESSLRAQIMTAQSRRG
jgi:septal ring factor EnvC (AmiA/AmiB activator)